VIKFTPFSKITDENKNDGIACGVYLLFRRGAYETIGGHEPVKNTILEDFAFGRLIKERGFRLGLMDGRGVIAARQYIGLNHLWNGWSKNYFGLIKGSLGGYFRAITSFQNTGPIPILIALSVFVDHPSSFELCVRLAPLSIVLVTAVVTNILLGINPLYAPLNLTLGCLFAVAIQINIIYSFFIRKELKVVGRIYSRGDLSGTPAAKPVSVPAEKFEFILPLQTLSNRGERDRKD
jgi:hypothetical protein